MTVNEVVSYFEPQVFIIALDSYEKDVTLDAVDFFNDFSRHNILVLRLEIADNVMLTGIGGLLYRGCGDWKDVPPYRSEQPNVSSENAIAKTKVLNIFGSFL